MRFTYFWPWWAVILGLLIMAGITVYTYLGLKRPLRRRFRFLLITLRILAASVLLICLLEPVLVEKKDITPPMNLLILADTSRSMALTDVELNGEPVSRLSLVNRLLFDASTVAPMERGLKEFLPKLNSRFDTHLYQFDKQSQQVTNPIEPLEADGGLTDIAAAIRHAAKEWRGQQLAGVVLITDGAHNASTFPMREIAEAQIPIYTVGVGNPQPPKDLKIAKVEVSPVVYMEHEVPIRITVSHTGYSGSQVRLSLRDTGALRDTEGAVIDATSMKLTEEQTETIEFTLIPQVSGTFQYTVSLPNLPDELTHEDNEKTFPLKVVKTKLRVLYIDGRPRWEYTFLKRALERDANVDATCLILSARRWKGNPFSDTRLPRTGGYYPQGTVPNQVSRFPTTLQGLLAYDVLIVGDIIPRALTQTQQRAIVDFVEKRGGAIVFLGGQNSLGINGYSKTALAELLPIHLPPNGCYVRDEDFSLELTPSGLYHPMMRLGDTQAKVEAIWRDLPTLSRWFSGFQLKGGATTLGAYRRTRGDSAVPIIIFHRIGLGKSLLIATEGVWNWAFGVWSFTDEDDTYPRLWGQIIRWMATRADTKQLNVTTDLSTYSVGDDVQVTLFAYNESYQPLNDAEVRIEVVPPGNKSFQLRTSPQPVTTGAYKAQFRAAQKGSYEIRATGSHGGLPLGEDSTAVFVQSQLAELENPQLNEGRLKELASKTGGVYTPIADVATLPDKIRDVQEPVFVTQERDIWDTPLVLILVLSMLGTEWFLRKRRGLV